MKMKPTFFFCTSHSKLDITGLVLMVLPSHEEGLIWSFHPTIAGPPPSTFYQIQNWRLELFRRWTGRAQTAKVVQPSIPLQKSPKSVLPHNFAEVLENPSKRCSWRWIASMLLIFLPDSFLSGFSMKPSPQTRQLKAACHLFCRRAQHDRGKRLTWRRLRNYEPQTKL